MSNKKTHPSKKSIPAKKKNHGVLIGSGVFIIVIAAIFIIKGSLGSNTESQTNTSVASQQSSDIKITKSQISDKVSFIPYNSNGIDMEIMAVKAPDGTIRTAFNTCQVCFDSGRGYYVQEGDELVCQNCGNRFKISQIEKEKNGCNPAPILEENKTDDGQIITISASFIEQNADLFSNWKTR